MLLAAAPLERPAPASYLGACDDYQSCRLLEFLRIAEIIYRHQFGDLVGVFTTSCGFS